MPRNKDIKSVLIIGSGPIIIGQACEFDYSGSQASRSLREEGIEVTLINSNPATIMTDKVTADHIYLLPLDVKSIIKILEERKIDAVLPTMGGQTALNLAMKCEEMGIWKKFEWDLLGDENDNVAIICSIENFAPMGVHTGDSITVAPAMTLSDTAYQRMRDMAIKMMRSIGNFSGGCNVQFAVSNDANED